MGNILNNNFHNLKLRVNRDEYWDFHLNKDYVSYYAVSDGTSLYDKCLISYIDASKEECISGSNIMSIEGYSWESANTTTYTLSNVGYVGMDNFLIPFRRDSSSTYDFLKLYSGSTYGIVEGDTRLKLHAVSGATCLYDYPYSFENGKIKLNGGFFQGFFETECDKYAILPSQMQNGDTWEFEFFLNKTEFEKESEKTLNDKYPNNKGIFFYLGTRAENKWVYYYNPSADTKTNCNVNIEDFSDYVDDEDMLSAKLYSGDEYTVIMPPTFEETFYDEYLTFKYYSPDTYEEGCLDEDDFALNDYVVLDMQPKIIDEEEEPSKVIGWCCNYTIEKKNKDIRTVCCGCGCCRNVSDGSKITSSTEKRYYTGCDYFGVDDYITVDEEMFEEYLNNEKDISQYSFFTAEDGFDLRIGGQYYFDTDNKFLFFDRTCDGFNTHNWDSDIIVRYYGVKSNFTSNLFLLMNRTCTGFTVHNIDEYRDSFRKDYNVYNDIYNNALAFRITDDGAIGYRYLTVDCSADTQTTIREAYSKDGIIKDGEWTLVHIKIEATYKQMIIRIYVNQNLVFVSDSMDKLNMRKLNDLYVKQETVPYNISIGGGTQGLAETIFPSFMDNPTRLYPLEEYFAGTFIGYIKTFRFYNCYSEYANIFNNFIYEMNNLE